MNLFRLDASIRQDGSVTRAIASTVESTLVEASDDITIVRRDLGRSPLPSTVWPLSAFAGYVPPDEGTPEQRDAVALAAELADELIAADAYIFAAPLYNWGVSEHVKTWVDIVLTDPRFSPRSQPIAGRPGVLIVARGGGYGPGTPREGWDHATPWLQRIFGDVYGLDLRVIEVELTLADVVAEMADLLGVAAENLDAGHAAAGEFGAFLTDHLMAGVR